MNAPKLPEMTDPELLAAADLLRQLPVEKPGSPISASVAEQVKPLAARRKTMMRALVLAALVAAIAYGVSLLWALKEAGA